MAQHLKAVEAASAISGARVKGAVFGGTTLVFEPQGILPGRYRFDIGTAGSTSLVLQAILIPLSFAAASSNVIVTGGTHVSWSPSFHYLERHLNLFLKKIGFDLDLEHVAAGYYPRGGGCVKATIRPARNISALDLILRGKLKRISGLSGATNLPEHIIQRQASQARKRLKEAACPVSIEERLIPGNGKGTFLNLRAQFEDSQGCYDALGARGKPAERVADEASDSLLGFLQGAGAIDEHLADQLILPLSFASGVSRLKTAKITSHLQTNVEVVRKFMSVRIHIKGETGEPGEVEIEGKEFSSSNLIH